MDASRILSLTYIDNLSSISLMNELIARDYNGEYKYDYILLNNSFMVWKDTSCYNVSLYIGRYVLGMPSITDYLTFTEIKNQLLKKQHYESKRKSCYLLDNIYDALDILLSRDDDKDEIFFDVPICFRAQNKYDRQIIGETTDYAFWGVKFSLSFSF